MESASNVKNSTSSIFMMKIAVIRLQNDKYELKFRSIRNEYMDVEIKDSNSVYKLKETLRANCVFLMGSIEMFTKNINQVYDVILWLNTIRIDQLYVAVTEMNDDIDSQVNFSSLKRSILLFSGTINDLSLNPILFIPITGDFSSDMFYRTNFLSWYGEYTLLKVIENVYKVSKKNQNLNVIKPHLKLNNFYVHKCINYFKNQRPIWKHKGNLHIFLRNAIELFNKKETCKISDLLTVYVIVINDMKDKIFVNSTGYLNSSWKYNTKFQITKILSKYDKYSHNLLEIESEYITEQNSALIKIQLENPIFAYLFDDFQEESFIRLYDTEHNLYAIGFIKYTDKIYSYEIREWQNFETFILFQTLCDRYDILRQIFETNNYNEPQKLLNFAKQNNNFKTAKMLLTVGLIHNEDVMNNIKKPCEELLHFDYSMESFNKFINVNTLVNNYLIIFEEIYSNFKKISNSLSNKYTFYMNNDMILIKHNVVKFQFNEYIGKYLQVCQYKLKKIIRDIFDPRSELILFELPYSKSNVEIENHPLIKIACELDSPELFMSCIKLFTNHREYYDTIHLTSFKVFLERKSFKILNFLIKNMYYKSPYSWITEMCENLDYNLFFYLKKRNFNLNKTRYIVYCITTMIHQNNWPIDINHNINFLLNFTHDNDFIPVLVRQLSLPKNLLDMNLILSHVFRLKIMNNNNNIGNVQQLIDNNINIKTLYEQYITFFEDLTSIDMSLTENMPLALSDLLLCRNSFDIFRFCNVDLTKLDSLNNCLYLEKFLYLQLAKIASIHFLESLLLIYFPNCVVDNILKFLSDIDILILLSKMDNFRSFFDCNTVKSKKCKILSCFTQLSVFNIKH